MDLWTWRIALEMKVSIADVQRWSFRQVYEAHLILDAQEAIQKVAEREARR